MTCELEKEGNITCYEQQNIFHPNSIREKYWEFEESGLIYVDLSWVNKSEHKLLHNLPQNDREPFPSTDAHDEMCGMHH